MKHSTCGCHRCGPPFNAVVPGPCLCEQCRDLGCWCTPDGHDEHSFARWQERRKTRNKKKVKR